jgi:hypothetical protein
MPTSSIMDVECHINDQVEFENVTLMFGQNKRVGCGWIEFSHIDLILETGQALKVSCNEKIADDVSHPEVLTPSLISMNTTFMIRCGI